MASKLLTLESFTREKRMERVVFNGKTDLTMKVTLLMATLMDLVSTTLLT